jgi:hypothetical protein
MTSLLFNLVYLLTHTERSGFIKLVTKGCLLNIYSGTWGDYYAHRPNCVWKSSSQTYFGCLHTVVLAFIWGTRLISSVLLPGEKMVQHLLTCYYGSSLHLVYKINFFLLYCCYLKKWISIYWHVTVVLAIIWGTRLISSLCTLCPFPTRLLILMHIKHTVSHLYIQPSSCRWTLRF